MSNISIPITLAWSPVAVDVQYTTLNELGTLLQSQLSGTVTDSVSFFLSGATPPTTDQGVIFYNTATGQFMAWSDSAGAYVVVSDGTQVGDVKFNYNSADEVSTGWVLASGSRTIDSITALSTNQNLAAHTLFGAGALIQIPNITAPTSTVGGGGGGGATLYPKIFLGWPIT